QHALRRARVVHHGRVHLQQGRNAAGGRGQDPFAAEVVVALDHDLGAGGGGQGLHGASGPEAEEAVRRAPGDAVPVDAVAVLARGRAGRAMDDRVDLVAAGGQAARDLEHVDAAPGAAGDALVGGHIEDPHAPRPGRSRPKKGPVRIPPKRTTSSFMSQVRATATARAARPGFGAGGSAAAGTPSPAPCAWPAGARRRAPSYSRSIRSSITAFSTTL